MVTRAPEGGYSLHIVNVGQDEVWVRSITLLGTCCAVNVGQDEVWVRSTTLLGTCCAVNVGQDEV